MVPGPLTAAIVYWNTIYLDHATSSLTGADATSRPWAGNTSTSPATTAGAS